MKVIHAFLSSIEIMLRGYAVQVIYLGAEVLQYLTGFVSADIWQFGTFRADVHDVFKILVELGI